ncbi:unnamed protein product [Calypogeia fissa]
MGSGWWGRLVSYRRGKGGGQGFGGGLSGGGGEGSKGECSPSAHPVASCSEGAKPAVGLGAWAGLWSREGGDLQHEKGWLGWQWVKCFGEHPLAGLQGGVANFFSNF